MPAFTFADIPDPEDFSPIPPGHYPAHYEHKETAHEYGNEKWTYNMVIDHGPHAGRRVKDSITWIQRPQNEKEMKIAQRCKLVISRLGFDVDQPGIVDYQPHHLEGCKAVIEVINKEQEDPSTGRTKSYNNIPFAGYERPDVYAAKAKASQQPPVAPAPVRSAPTASPALAPPAAAVPEPGGAPPASAPVAESRPPQPAAVSINPPEFSVDDLPF